MPIRRLLIEEGVYARGDWTQGVEEALHQVTLDHQCSDAGFHSLTDGIVATENELLNEDGLEMIISTGVTAEFHDEGLVFFDDAQEVLADFLEGVLGHRPL